jgi:hypothetical protein
MATRLEQGQAQLRSAAGVPMERVTPQQVEFLGPRAEARTNEILAQNIDRMTQGILEYGKGVRQREGLQFVIDTPPTEAQMLAAREGDVSTLLASDFPSAFNQAVKKARSFQLAERAGAQIREDVVGIANQAEQGLITPEKVKTEIDNRRKGYTASIAQFDGEAALRFDAGAAADGHVAYKAALDAAAKKTKEQEKIEFIADTNNKIIVYKRLSLTNPNLAPQYEELFRSSILKAARLHGPAVYKEYQDFVDKEFAAARQSGLLQHLSDERYLSNPRETFKQLNSGVFDPLPGQDALFQNEEVKTLLGWMRVNDSDNLGEVIQKFMQMAAQRKQGIDLALVDAEQQGKQLLRDIYKAGTTIATMNQKLKLLQNLPVEPSVIKQARDYIKDQSKPTEGSTNLLVYNRYLNQAKNGALNIEQLIRDPSISASDKKSLVGLNSNTSPALSNGFKNIEFSGGQTSENLPPNFDSAEGKKAASDAIATQKQALLNYAQTPDNNGNFPSGSEISKKANELANGVKTLLGKTFLKEAQNQKRAAEMGVKELENVDLNNDDAVKKAIIAAEKRGVKLSDINMAKNAIRKYREAIKDAPK